MKYQFVNARLSKDKRAFHNQQVLTKLATGSIALNANEVFNKFTGIGGLHGLKYTDFENFHEYTEAKKELEFGQFFTPPDLCQQIISSLQPAPGYKVADFTCGSGNFFNYLPTESNIYGCEIEPDAFKVARFLYPDANIVEGDFVTVKFDTTFDMVVGNPPFNLKTAAGVSQFVFITKAAEYLLPGRLLCFIAPKTFLEDELMNKRRLEKINADFSFICQAEIPKHYFDVDIDIKVMYFHKYSPYISHNKYSNTYVPFDADAIHNNNVKPVIENLKANAARLYRLAKTTTAIDRTDELMTKYVYEIKTHKRLKKHIPAALEKLTLLKEQRKPDEMSWQDWQKAMLKPEEVVNWLHKVIRDQYKPAPKKIMKLVKTKNSIKFKAYSKARAAEQKEISMQELITRDADYVTKQFKKLVARKRAAYRLQETPMQKMERIPAMDAFLKQFELKELNKGMLSMFAQDDETIRLNDKQFTDLGLSFQKKYSILNWQQGGGKSVAGMAWLKYVKPSVQYSFICAPSLAVQLTWKPRLTKYGFAFTLVEQWSDFAKIRKGSIVLMSFDMVRILQRHLKNFIKKEAGYKIALLVDESDELTNIGSSRTRAMLSCFRKAKHKLLTTGTTTRNNINELYPQLELLYNNSVNLTCWSTHTYRPDKDNEIQIAPNENYGKPFVAWRGHNLFKWCHCPQRTTVFGIKQDTQDVYNADALKAIIDKTIITRTFDDIVGKRIYKLKTHHVVQGKEEHRLYAKIIDEFYQIVYTYFNSTGNTRKEAALRMIRQITLLIQSTSIPHTFPHYEGSEKPQKFYYINDRLKEWNEKVAIGTVLIEAAQDYYKFIAHEHPNRPLFYIDGSNSFSSRKKILAAFQATDNGILVSTQQALKSSVDIETCNKCILESLQWNIPKMSQYWFRFIRYNSKEDKEIHLITYADTIEQNILALLMSKEKLNEFIKKPDQLQSREEIMNDFDIDVSILDQLITKEYDHEGKLHLRWGKGVIKAA